MNRKQGMSLIICTLLIAVMPFSMFRNASAADSIPNGLFLDNIRFNVITEESTAIQALIDDEIQLIGNAIDPQYVPELEQAAGIKIAEILRNGYGYLTINCRKHPLNYTAFRRAFAFAINKQKICDEALNGRPYPQDSVIPRINPFSIEEEMTYHYYNADVTEANRVLDNAGFEDVDSDSFREAPDGSDFEVRIIVPSSSSFCLKIGEIAVEALTAIDIDARYVAEDFYEYLSRIYAHHEYDIALLWESFSHFDVEWLAYEYWSEYSDEIYYNFPNFANASYDGWRNQLLHNTTLEGVMKAAKKMQEILVYQSPEIVCYEGVEFAAYRNDRLGGFVNQAGLGPFSFWTSMQAHLRENPEDPFGGTLNWSLPLDVNSFSLRSPRNFLIEDLLYDSLLRQGPEGTDINWLAESYIIETHEDNEEVAPGHTRFTFELVLNATWTDGKPLTADDVAFSFNYYRDARGTPFGHGLGDILAVYAESSHTVVIEFNTESYWHLHTIAYTPIIPKHVFSDISPDDWNEYNPIPPDEKMVTSGPYNVTEHLLGNYLEFSRNPNYFYQSIPSQSTDVTSTTAKPSIPPLRFWGAALATASAVTIVGTIFLRKAHAERKRFS